MSTVITKKIVGYKVLTTKNNEPPVETILDSINIELLDEELSRPEYLPGNTFKIKTPQSDHALYITINDIILNKGTQHEERRPYEMFINSKNMEHYQWVVAMTRLISAVFRKGGDATFLVDELKNVFDPQGGYWKKGGVYMPSLVAEIGHTLETHMTQIGMIKPKIDANQQAFLAEKRKEFNATDHGIDFPSNATLCSKCNTKAMVLMDGCQTCLNCGDSKCG